MSAPASPASEPSETPAPEMPANWPARFAVFAFDIDGFATLNTRDQETCTDAATWAWREVQSATSELRSLLRESEATNLRLVNEARAYAMCVGADPDQVPPDQVMEAANNLWREMKGLGERLAASEATEASFGRLCESFRAACQDQGITFDEQDCAIIPVRCSREFVEALRGVPDGLASSSLQGEPTE